MKKTSFKLFPTIALVLALFFSLFFISNTKVSAQNDIVVDTTGYSVLSPNAFVFGGAYSGNFDKSGFTTYFEFKKNDANLNDSTDREETIKIVRDTNIEESNVFYSSPELKLFSTYYFRAVGYLNDNPDQKFYGDILSMTTGDTLPLGVTGYPFTTGINNIPTDNSPSFCTFSQIKINNVCVDNDQPSCDPKTEQLVDNVCKTKNQPVCNPEKQVLENGICKDKITTPPNVLSSTTLEPSLGLVKCGTLRYAKGEQSDANGRDMEGQVKNPCGFKDVITLINNVINFILFKMAVPIAAIMFAYAGFELVTSGGSTEKKSKAKSIFTNVAIGLIIVAAAFVIIKTILSITGYVTDGGWNWFGF